MTAKPYRSIRRAMLALVLVGAACSDDNNTTIPDGATARPDGAVTSPDAAATAKAHVRVVHAAPGAPNVDIYAAGVATPLITNLAYGETSGYVDVAPGSYVVDVRAAGSAATSAPAYSTGSLALTADEKLTAVAAGLLSSTAAADSFRVLPLVEGFGAAASGKARVRVVHAGSDAPSVDIDVGDDGTAELTGLARFTDTGASGVDLPAGSALQIGIRAGGARVTAFTTPALPAGADLFVIATGLLGKLPRDDQGFSLLAVGPSGTIGRLEQNPVVYALHGAPDAPAVDLFAGPSELADNLTFGQLSASIQVPPGTYTIDVFAHAAGSTRPAGDPVRSASTPALAAGERYLAIATGFLAPATGEPAFRLLAFRDGIDVDAAMARVRVVHSSPDAPTVDVGTVSGGTVTPVPELSDLSFGEASAEAGTVLPSATLPVGIAAHGSTTAVASYSVTTVDGLRAFAVALGALTATETRQGFRIGIINVGVSPWTIAFPDPL